MIILIYLPLVIIATFAFINAQLSFILLSPDHFGIESTMIGSAVSKVIFTAYVVSTLLTPIAGYIYDLCGRKGPILFCIFGNIGLLFAIPYTAPNFGLLVLVRAMIAFFFTILETNPLVMDYIKNDSIGTAVALGTIGMLIGEAFSMAVLLGCTVSMTLED